MPVVMPEVAIAAHRLPFIGLVGNSVLPAAAKQRSAGAPIAFYRISWKPGITSAVTYAYNGAPIAFYRISWKPRRSRTQKSH